MKLNIDDLSQDIAQFVLEDKEPNWNMQPNYLREIKLELLNDIASTITWCTTDAHGRSLMSVRARVMSPDTLFRLIKVIMEATLGTLLSISERPSGNTVVVTARRFTQGKMTELLKAAKLEHEVSRDCINNELATQLQLLHGEAKELLENIDRIGYDEAIKLNNEHKGLLVNARVDDLFSNGEVKGGVLGVDYELGDFEPEMDIDDTIPMGDPECLTNSESDAVFAPKDHAVRLEVDKLDASNQDVLDIKAKVKRQAIVDRNRQHDDMSSKAKPLTPRQKRLADKKLNKKPDDGDDSQYFI